jgi:acetate kinase
MIGKLRETAPYTDGRRKTRPSPLPHLLTINCGSSSVKFAIFRLGDNIEPVLRGSVTEIGKAQGHSSARSADSTALWHTKVSCKDHGSAIELVLNQLEDNAELWRISLVGHRIVHGGPDFVAPLELDSSREADLDRLTPLSPVHLPANLAGIEAVRQMRPQATQFACFDTAFHSAMPENAVRTGLPLAMEGGVIRRYGFHGLSYESVLYRLVRREGRTALKNRILIAHLGVGASMVAVHHGRTIDTSMGFSPLSGLPMATRSGDIDPGLILYLINEEGWAAEELVDLLNNRSGLLGQSGTSGDAQILVASNTGKDAEDAIAFFCYQARRHLGALIAVMGGIDRLIFTGGIGENSPEVRHQICKPLEKCFGTVIDPEKNNAGKPLLSAKDAPVAIEISPADEEFMIARHVAELVANGQKEKAIL